MGISGKLFGTLKCCRRKEGMMAKKLAGKVALVTGASSGIGEATAIALAEEGARVAVLARRSDHLEKIVKRIKDAGGEAVADVIVFAVTRPEHVSISEILVRPTEQVCRSCSNLTVISHACPTCSMCYK